MVYGVWLSQFTRKEIIPGMPVIGRFVATGGKFKERIGEGELVILFIPTFRAAEPFAPSDIICFEPLRYTGLVLQVAQEKIEITYILVYTAEERGVFADIHGLPWHPMRKALHVCTPILYRPHGVGTPMRILDSRSPQFLLQQRAQIRIFSQ